MVRRMSIPKAPRVTYRKYRGNDSHSWAVFIEGRPGPVESGLTRTEAQYAKLAHQRRLAERGR